MSPGLPGALFVAVALTLPTTCIVLAQWLDRRPRRRGFWWRVGALQGVTSLAALTLLAGPKSEPALVNAPSSPAAPTPTAPTGPGHLSRGYHAGRALATDRHHRGTPPPRPEALAAMARLHGRGEPPEFLEGFRRGYLAGLNETTRPPSRL